jgi:hypothetical protein
MQHNASWNYVLGRLLGYFGNYVLGRLLGCFENYALERLGITH